jgi:UDP-N-acetylglucosamine transferase subunit ALG13
MRTATQQNEINVFVTVGTQLPFDRLVRTVDEWAGRHPHAKVFGQIGPTTYHPRHMQWAQFIEADECRRRVKEATAVVAHAGMGTIITSLELGTPIVVVPRQASLGEHRNDHQIATARNLLAQNRVIVAFDEEHLLEKLAHLERLPGARGVSRYARPQLLAVLREFIATGRYSGHRAGRVENATANNAALVPTFAGATAGGGGGEAHLSR